MINGLTLTRADAASTSAFPAPAQLRKTMQSGSKLDQPTNLSIATIIQGPDFSYVVIELMGMTFVRDANGFNRIPQGEVWLWQDREAASAFMSPALKASASQAGQKYDPTEDLATFGDDDAV